MKIDYGKIVTNALSTLVAAVFVGAAVIVWNAANSIDERVQLANKDILKQQAAMSATQKTIVPELTNIKGEMEEIGKQVKSIIEILSKSESLKGTKSNKLNKSLLLNKLHENKDLTDWKKKEADKLLGEINTKQMQIYERSIKK